MPEQRKASRKTLKKRQKNPGRINEIMTERLEKHLEHITAFLKKNHAGIILISGPMRAGKSALLLKVLKTLGETPNILRAKPARDTRSHNLESRDGNSASVHSVKDAQQFKELINEHKANIIVFDEAQFSDTATHQAIIEIAKEALVIVASLDLNFRAEEFTAYTTLCTKGPEEFGEAFLLVKLTGVCQDCSNEVATHSKLVEKPPETGDILVGDAAYRTVCRNCHATK